MIAAGQRQVMSRYLACIVMCKKNVRYEQDKRQLKLAI
jgi:hypothetical protein